MADEVKEISLPFNMTVPPELKGAPIINEEKKENQNPNPKPEDKVDPAKDKVETPANTEVEETEEQIQAKLDELAKKEDKDLTDDDKKYIQKYTPEVDEITTVKQAFEQRFGVELQGQYSNDEVGLATLADEVTKVRANQMVAEYFENIPHLKEFYQHMIVEKRGIDTFLEKSREPAFKNIKLEAASDSNDESTNKKVVENQRSLVRMSMLAKGLPEDDINTIIDLYEDKGTLFDKAKEAKASLETAHKSSVDAKLKAEEQRIQQEQEAALAEYKAMEEMITKNNFDGISLPAADIKAFKQAQLQVVDDKGNTLLDYKRANLTLAQRAIIDYFVFKDFKVEGLAKIPESTKKTFSFKKANEANNARNGGRTRGVNSDSGSNNITDPKELSKIFNPNHIKVERQ